MGGEWGVGASLVMEKVSPRWRGVISGLLQEGYAAGYLLAAVAYYFVFPRWGWRPLFFIGGLPALLALFIRYGVKESEVWEKTRHKNWSDLLRAIASHWKTFFYLVLLMTFMNFASHGTQDIYPTFLEKDWGFSPQLKAMLTATSMVGAIVGGVLFGLLSDRIGRRRAMLLAFTGALIAIPVWAFSPTLGLLLCGGVLMQAMVQGAWGVIPAHITELSDDSVRGFLPGFAYQCGVLIAGTIGYVQTLFAAHLSYAKAMAGSQALVFAGAIVVVAIGRERHRMKFGR